MSAFVAVETKQLSKNRVFGCGQVQEPFLIY